MQKLLTFLIFAAIGYFVLDQSNLLSSFSLPSSSNHDIISDAFERRLNDLQVNGSGKVIRLLSDDNEGSRHQRFIIETSTGQTLLMAHNIDLAPRISSLQKGDKIEFNGVYEWNSKGGVIHWTHHDPQGAHIAGWIKHNGRTYE